jgi:(1->4)-alpha-D-glucan 1-alpha-D-glucosylmutase
MRERRQRHPQEMLATTTHDTKRSEDARARIAVISEIPDAWQSAVMTWRRLNATNRTQVTGNYAPDPNDEYLFYQSLVGAWPCENLELDGPVAAPADLVARMSAYMQKAIKEAKLHTSWITPNAEYESAVERFVQRTLTGQSAGAFLTAFVAFVRRIARAGATNALSQLLLKLCAPGVPDFYQGTELWDLSLVDPDNRRAVDWPLRQRAFASVEALLDEGDVLPEPARIATAVPGPRRRAVADLLASWPDGRLKLLVTALVLRWRRAHPAVFAEGDYVPLAVSGTRAEHVVAFARRAGPDTLLVAVPRLTMGLSTAGGWATGEASWGDTTIRLPGTLAGRPIRALLDSRQWDAVPPDGTSVDLPVREVFQTLPIAILWSHGSTAPAHDAAPSG